MQARTWLVRVASTSLVVWSTLVGTVPAQASGQTVTGTVLLAANGGGVARREWNASNGAVNGANGYVFAVDPASVGTYFTLNLAPTNQGVGSLSIFFYTDMASGTTCSQFDGSPNAAGVVCGNHGIVWTPSGADLSFVYQSGMAVPAPPAFLASKFTFTTPIALQPAPGQTVGNIGEPSISVDPANGNIYVDGPTGIPCGLNTTDECVAFWRSTDGGATFTQPDPTAFHHPIGGGDTDVIHDGLSNVFVDDLRSLVDTGVFRSTDQGNTWTSTDTGPCSDRPWLAWGGWHAPTGPTTIYETQNSGVCGPGALLQFYRSVDDGVTFLPTGVVDADLTTLGYTADATVGGAVEAHLAVDANTGAIYVAWATQALQDGTDQTTRILLVAKSTDGGSTFHNKVVYSGPLGTSIQNLFPVITVDHGGNVYAAFSTQLPDGSLMGAYLTMSTDGGQTWTPIQRVSPTTQTAVFPAIASGDDGKVDLIWIGTSATSSSDPSAQWNIYIGQSRDADDGATAKWSIGQISQQVMHRGDICNQGLNCNIFGGNRDLADFISVTVDVDGNANAVWTDDASQSPKAVMFAKQIGGPTTGRQPPKS
jgi:hypothetical protein